MLTGQLGKNWVIPVGVPVFPCGTRALGWGSFLYDGPIPTVLIPGPPACCPAGIQLALPSLCETWGKPRERRSEKQVKKGCLQLSRGGVGGGRAQLPSWGPLASGPCKLRLPLPAPGLCEQLLRAGEGPRDRDAPAAGKFLESLMKWMSFLCCE